ncbi:Nod factor hydrolase protein 1 [Stylosanthes scabra]|uniref:Nod factor hydrolase protein 1 n=1 Tax=Stylosanthes scabra TaxID=79078 RepID=A0ABU6TD40_9FABA|nr:Nod factor hydrolase protein 1 [Stylosanthes scabra]
MENQIFLPSSINTSLFTHAYYAFLFPDNLTYALHVSNATAATLTDFTTTLRAKTPPLKTMLSIGGSLSNSTLFAVIASTAAARASFINSTIQVSRTFGFEGIDLDWEFPADSNQMNDLGQLFQEWRLAISAEAAATRRPPLLLTAAVYFAVDFFLSTTSPCKYPVASINQNVDFVNVMSYSLQGPWTNVTGAPSGLLNPTRNISVSFGLQSWIQGGIVPEKVVMGMPLYGLTWQLQDPNVHGIGAGATGPGPGLNGAMAYFQVLEFNNQSGGKVVYDIETASVYSYSGSSWIGYDDLLTVTVKISYAQALCIRGYFLWAAGFDTTDWKISTRASKAWIHA